VTINRLAVVTMPQIPIAGIGVSFPFTPYPCQKDFMEKVIQALQTVSVKDIMIFKGVMTQPIVDELSELCSPFLKRGNSAFITAIASGLFPQTEYQSLE